MARQTQVEDNTSRILMSVTIIGEIFIKRDKD